MHSGGSFLKTRRRASALTLGSTSEFMEVPGVRGCWGCDRAAAPSALEDTPRLPNGLRASRPMLAAWEKGEPLKDAEALEADCGDGGKMAIASLAADTRCVAAAAMAAAVDAGRGETVSAWLDLSEIILRRDAKLSMMPPSSLLLLSSKTPSKEEADAARDRREVDAAVKFGRRWLLTVCSNTLPSAGSHCSKARSRL